MQKPNLKHVVPIHQNEFVTVPSTTWNKLCKTVNDIIDVLNTHSSDIEACNTNLSKLAKITEEIYEILE